MKCDLCDNNAAYFFNWDEKPCYPEIFSLSKYCGYHGEKTLEFNNLKDSEISKDLYMMLIILHS